MLQQAIQHYHNLMTNRLAKVSQEHLDEQQQRYGLYFGERPLCTVLRPRFFTHAQYRFIQQRVKLLMAAFDRAYRLALVDRPFRDQFGLLEWEEALVDFDPGFRAPSPVSRLDAFYLTDSEQLLFTEYNAEVPAAPAYNDVLTQAFYCMPIMRKFAKEYQVKPLPARPFTLHALLEVYYSWPYREGPPQVAILDWSDVPTYSEFVLFDKYFAENGIASRIVDPRECEYRDGKLMAGDFHITLIYKRVLIDELVQRMGMDSPVMRAVKDHAVCMINPFRCKILYKKSSFAVLSDERNERYFTETERAAIDAHIPWTRRVEERYTRFGDAPVDLIPFIVKYKDRFALKPNDDYGGRGIVLGWTVDQSVWEDAVRAAMKFPYVVQERIILPTEPYPSFVDGRLQITDRLLDTAPFVFNGAYMDGCLTRLSTDPLINVTAGGGSTVPTFIIEER